jgi:hypothetical protein
MVIVEKIRHETDLSLMEQHFPGRSRNDIKNKFKKEEKLRPKFVDKMLSERKPYDPNQFLNDDPGNICKKSTIIFSAV